MGLVSTGVSSKRVTAEYDVSSYCTIAHCIVDEYSAAVYV